MPHGHGRKFDPARRAYLMSKEREAYLPARQILARFPFRAGQAIGDVGCGPGFFAFPLAEIAGTEGVVYALDIEEAMLDEIRTGLAARPGLRVEVRQSEEHRLPLPDRSLDAAFLGCVLHELEGGGTLREIRRALRPDGFLAVVDWMRKTQDIGPPLRHRLSPKQAVKRLAEGGFAGELTFEVGAHHYGILARPRA